MFFSYTIFIQSIMQWKFLLKYYYYIIRRFFFIDASSTRSINLFLRLFKLYNWAMFEIQNIFPSQSYTKVIFLQYSRNAKIRHNPLSTKCKCAKEVKRYFSRNIRFQNSFNISPQRVCLQLQQFLAEYTIFCPGGSFIRSRFKHPSDSVPLNCAEWHNLSATLRLIIVYEARPRSLCSTTARSLFERERQRQTAGWVYVPELINLQPLRLHTAVPPSLILSF